MLGESPAVVAQQYSGPAIPFGWKRCVELQVQNPGITLKELAKELQVNAGTICGWRKRPEYQQYENWVLQREAPSAITAIMPAAQVDRVKAVKERFETYLDEMESRLMHILETTESEKLQVEIIQDIFDRTGFAPKKDEARVTPLVVTGEAMAEFMRRAAEAGISVIPAPVVEGEVIGHSSI
jgi:transposase-like protein